MVWQVETPPIRFIIATGTRDKCRLDYGSLGSYTSLPVICRKQFL